MSNTQDSNPLDDDQPPLADGRLQVALTIGDDVVESLPVQRICDAVVVAASHLGFDRGLVGVHVTGDAEIHVINREHLGHDYATDVISFGYGRRPPLLEGELVVSAETARREADGRCWSADDELVLYVIHGTLHIAGLDDADPRDREEMRRAENAVLETLGIDPAKQTLAGDVTATCESPEGGR